MSATKVKLTINKITLMNRGPAIKRKRSKRGFDALSTEEACILAQYKALIGGKVETETVEG